MDNLIHRKLEEISRDLTQQALFKKDFLTLGGGGGSSW